MILDVVLNPAEIVQLAQRDLSSTTCVVFDVLRATSSMITALAHGAEEIWPARTIEEAMTLRERLPNAILGGERHGERIDGFALGNSPFEYRDQVAGRTIVSTTTNGTMALRACEHSKQILVGAILNLDAVAAAIMREPEADLLLVCAGTFNDFALEDACAAGLLIAALHQIPGRRPEFTFTDAAQAALGVAKLFPDPLTTLRTAKNGRVLMAKGRGAEVEWCAQRSRYKVVGLMRQGVIRPMPT